MLENIEAAKDNFNKAVQLNADNGIVYVQKCFTDFRYGATVKDTTIIERALQDFETAFTKFPDCIDCYILYAQVPILFRFYLIDSFILCFFNVTWYFLFIDLFCI